MKQKLLYCVLIVLGFLALSYGFVPEVLKGKIVNQSDISGWVGMAHEMTEWNAAHPDDPTAWTGSMFSGMPTTTIQSSTKGDWTQKIYDFLLTGRRPATYLFISLLGAFLMMLAFGIGPLLAAGGAVAVTFCAYNLQIIQVGHNTKMQALAFLPWVVAAFVFAYRKALQQKPSIPLSLLGAALFGLTLSFQVKANHQQISYYLAILLLGYALALLISLICSKSRRNALGRYFAISALLLVLGGAGIATNASKMLPTIAYTPYSMRGGSSDGATSGLQLDYATSWSYGWEELPNLMIPNFNGGSSSGAVKPSRSETYKVLKRAGQPNAKKICENLPLYWGPQPFTAGPMYIGAVTIFLFLMGLMLCRGWQKWWLAACSLLAVFLALGNHFMIFTKFFYDFAPLYNKFRTVSMALVTLQFTLPLLGFIALDRIIRGGVDAAQLRKASVVALAVSGGFCLLCLLFPGIAGSYVSDYDSSLPKLLAEAIEKDRMMLMRSDALRSLLLILGTFCVVLWAGRKISSRGTAMAAIICVLVLVDLFPLGKRYLNSDHFVTPRDFSSQFEARPVDKMILEDKDPSYRVVDLSVNTFNDSHPSYWHKNIGGYSPAKLQRYQEYIDSHLMQEISLAKKFLSAGRDLPYLEGLSKLNCRYIIVSADQAPVRNPHAKGNAWFKDGNAPIELFSYAPNSLRYRYDSATGGNAVFSEVFYPDGWTLTLEDGTPVKITLEDEILRGAELPAGSHELEMRFAPVSYSRGEAVSRASSILLILLVLISVASAAFFVKRDGSKG